MKLNDRVCPSCGVTVLRTHHCRGRRDDMTDEQRAAAIQACYDAIKPRPRPVAEPLPLELPQDTSWVG